MLSLNGSSLRIVHRSDANDEKFSFIYNSHPNSMQIHMNLTRLVIQLTTSFSQSSTELEKLRLRSLSPSPMVRSYNHKDELYHNNELYYNQVHCLLRITLQTTIKVYCTLVQLDVFATSGCMSFCSWVCRKSWLNCYWHVMRREEEYTLVNEWLMCWGRNLAITGNSCMRSFVSSRRLRLVMPRSAWATCLAHALPDYQSRHSHQTWTPGCWSPSPTQRLASQPRGHLPSLAPAVSTLPSDHLKMVSSAGFTDSTDAMAGSSVFVQWEVVCLLSRAIKAWLPDVTGRVGGGSSSSLFSVWERSGRIWM